MCTEISTITDYKDQIIIILPNIPIFGDIAMLQCNMKVTPHLTG